MTAWIPEPEVRLGFTKIRFDNNTSRLNSGRNLHLDLSFGNRNYLPHSSAFKFYSKRFVKEITPNGCDISVIDKFTDHATDIGRADLYHKIMIENKPVFEND